MAETCRHEKVGTPEDVLVEIVFPLDAGAWHGFAAEALWAERIADDRFLIRSAPFHAFDVSAEDVVSAHPSNGALRFHQVVERGGGSTYRLFVRSGLKDPVFARYWSPLEELDCNYEATDGSLLSIDVPSQADIEEVYALLEEGESAGVWEFEEGHVGHVLEPSHASWRPVSSSG
ncbi:MAG: DUF4265 domain-containing protein [Deltaproteobacteria bacterium]|nr:DUF4265 domain-containing protein [Deltaproteobacteria bacterium]